ncbi:MAG: beta-propeller fold lactonase family protein [Verrucomicrobia bacterium]|nr:beta-propeller fold lactonase family protein [Verrucomicrobiota bacterium]
MKHCCICRSMAAFGVGFLVFQAAAPLAAKEPPLLRATTETIGRVGVNRYLTPTGQALTPAGRQVELLGMRPQALALSPDGKLLATSGKTNFLVLIDVASGQILQQVRLSTNKVEVKTETKADATDSTTDDATSPEIQPETSSSGTTNATASSTNTSRWNLSLTGLTFSPDGQRIYVSSVGGFIRVFGLDKKRSVTNFATWTVPDAKAPKQRREIPAGLAVSSTGRRLYVAGNLGNKLHEFDTDTGTTLRTWDAGVAPYDVALAAGKVYVSNLGGRRPGTNDLKAPAGKGMTVRVDPVRHLASEGSVTVVDLTTGAVKTEILVGLHASALAVSPDKKYVVVANTGSDTLSVIDARTDEVVEKIWARQTPADLFGAQPNALAFDRSGKRLFVGNGTQNAVAVVQFDPADKESRVLGLIPVGWFPGGVAFSPVRKTICVANIKGLGAMRVFNPGDKVKISSKNYFGTVSLVPQPSTRELAMMTELALRNMRYPMLAEAKLPPRAGQPPRPVPERVGEPSVFKHVIYVIKENRTYDQILGDMPEGNGDTNLCTFGEKYTPNQHKMAREFVLLDNTYCAGVQSADGHQWTDSAIANEYVERQLTSDFPRSYPGAKVEDGIDALAWASSGFIWDNALAHGKTFRNYGEWMISEAGWKDRGRRGRIAWKDYWNDYVTGTNQTRLKCRPGIETLRPYSPTNTVGWDLHVPDVMRAAAFIKELRQFETNGAFPNLVMLFLPNDHTGGTRGRYPKPGAQVADNDLAFGQVVEAVTHSKFWPQTCLFAIEDDPQAGWDHVSGYRTTCYVVSPYTKRRQTVSTQYNQTSLMRTMELILGLPPMNQLDAVASPMTDCFNDTPDLTPFLSVTNHVPLDAINPEAKKVANRILRQDALLSERLPLDEPDRCPEDVLNRILWRAMKGPDVPYPEWAVTAVEDDE